MPSDSVPSGTTLRARARNVTRRLSLSLLALLVCLAVLALPLAGVAQEPIPPAPVAAMSAAQIAAAGAAGAVIVVEPAGYAPVATNVVGQPPASVFTIQPVAVEGPRLNPPAIPHSNVLSTTTIYHELLTPPPLPALQANLAADAIGELQEAPGRGISEAVTPISSGLTLFPASGSALVVTLLPAGSGKGASLPVALTPAVGRTVIGKVELQPVTVQSSVVVETPIGVPVVSKEGEVGAPAATPVTAPVTLGDGKTVYSPFLIVPDEVVANANVLSGTAVSQVLTTEATRFEPVLTTVEVPAAPVASPSGARTYTLVDHVCLDFNAGDEWASHRVNSPSDVWTDWFAGWGPFAVDDGLYNADNVTFSLERVVGPGINYGDNQHSAKIASNQPYAAGFGSPRIQVRPGAVVIVAVNYLIFDHDTHGDDYDWASLGLKPDAAREGATYVNGFVRGKWATMMHNITAGPTGEVMVLIQAHSPAALNSNIYFDNVRIWVDGLALSDCRYE